MGAPAGGLTTPPHATEPCRRFAIDASHASRSDSDGTGRAPIDLPRLARVVAPFVRLLEDRLRARIQSADPWSEVLFTRVHAVAPHHAHDGLAASCARAAALVRVVQRCIHGPHRHGALPSVALPVQSLISHLTDPGQDGLTDTIFDDLTQALAAVDIAPEPDPIVHFPEHLLAALQPRDRAAGGVFYTPRAVTDAMVAQVDHHLRTHFGLPLGLADPTPWHAVAGHLGRPVPEGIDPSQPFVHILDPCTGTGAFLAAVIRHIYATCQATWAHLPPATQATRWHHHVHDVLLPRLTGIELRLPALLVAHLHLGRVFASTGVVLGSGVHLICADTLTASPRRWHAPITVLVGNPPYARHARPAPGSHPAGWIHDGHPAWNQQRPPFDDYVAGARARGAGRHLKSLHNLYVYFWRWSTWRVFDHGAQCGVVCLVTASSFLQGPGFVGMRDHLRGQATGIQVLDLEGQRRGTRSTENVFHIAAPVCVTTAWRTVPPESSASIQYARLTGSRREKLHQCTAIAAGAPIDWQSIHEQPGVPFVATRATPYDRWPRVTDLFPWQHSGVQLKRTWPIGPTAEVLSRRWQALLTHPSRATAFRETRAWRIDRSPRPLLPTDAHAPALSTLPRDAPLPRCVPYGARSFDRRWILADARLGDRLRPPLWWTAGPRQIYLTSLLSGILGDGPAATVSAHPPDLHHFRGSYGGKDIIPLWRDPQARVANVTVGLLPTLAEHLGTRPSPFALFAYTYAILAQPAYTAKWSASLQIPGPRIPLSADPTLFRHGVRLGTALLHWHTFGLRDPSTPLHGTARADLSQRIVPTTWRYDAEAQVLHVGSGTIAPVTPATAKLSVSGMPVLARWLDHRVGRAAGRRSSPLDDIQLDHWSPALTQELLELVWVLEWTVQQYPALAQWRSRVEAGALLAANALPQPTSDARRPPRIPPQAP